MITTVVFDLDDTIYDEIEYCRSGFASVADFVARISGTSSSESIFDCFWGQFKAGNHTRVFNDTLEKLCIAYDDDLIARLVAVYRNHEPELTLPDESRQTLEKLMSKYELAILTDGFLPAQELKVQALGLEKYFKCIVYTERLGRNCWKPSPAGFKKVLSSLNVQPQSAVYVADNEKKDFIAPNKLGMVTIQIVRPARIHTGSAEGPDGKAQQIIQKITELPPLLETL